MNQILIDSGFLAAIYNRLDTNHDRAARFIKQNVAELLIPEVTLTEVAFLLNREGGVPAVAMFLRTFAASKPVLQSLTLPDLDRARAIMLTYASARLDFVDCCVMALSERLNISQVATFDWRDFAIFRPSHCPALALLP